MSQDPLPRYEPATPDDPGPVLPIVGPAGSLGRPGWYSYGRRGGAGLFWGLILVGVGGVFLLHNVGLIPEIDWNLVWPVALIGGGIYLIARRLR